METSHKYVGIQKISYICDIQTRWYEYAVLVISPFKINNPMAQ